jgi:hypothetical protein
MLTKSAIQILKQPTDYHDIWYDNYDSEATAQRRVSWFSVTTNNNMWETRLKTLNRRDYAIINSTRTCSITRPEISSWQDLRHHTRFHQSEWRGCIGGCMGVGSYPACLKTLRSTSSQTLVILVYCYNIDRNIAWKIEYQESSWG